MLLKNNRVKVEKLIPDSIQDLLKEHLNLTINLRAFPSLHKLSLCNFKKNPTDNFSIKVKLSVHLLHIHCPPSVQVF